MLLKANNAAEKLQMEELALAMKHQDQQMDNQRELMEANMKGQAQVYDILNTQAQTLKTLKDAMGADAIMSPTTAEAYEQQAEAITGQQDHAEQLTEQEASQMSDNELFGIIDDDGTQQ